MVLTKKTVIGLTLAGVLALSGTSVFAASEASSQDVKASSLTATKAGKPVNGTKGELKAKGEIPESVRKGLTGQTTGNAGEKQITLEEVEGVELDLDKLKENALEGKLEKAGIPISFENQLGGKTTSSKK
ncbi:hypothetical protein ACFOQM_04285 [Paenibacillus sp. GCM10012307]|uniref:Uncharacterized protein n=1 Tax=Paenibacillus roseus TaxID=2798579 RepID=A0A934J548_9BACL|nr:hypothetical protein [Paenibacillus roseus]MBJ6360532.1 hypothetical protein [Paenibacillus roseus]